MVLIPPKTNGLTVNYFLRTRDSETSHLQEAKKCTSVLEKQRSELEKADNFPESSNTEVTKLRTQWLKHTNEIDQSSERTYQNDFNIERYGPRVFFF